MDNEDSSFYNVEKRGEITNNKVVDLCIKRHIPEHYLTETNLKIFKWYLKSYYNNVDFSYFVKWPQQTGRYLDCILEFMFNLTRQVDSIVLSDDEFILVANFCNSILNINARNLYNYSHSLSQATEGRIIQVIDIENKKQFFFVSKDYMSYNSLYVILKKKYFPVLLGYEFSINLVDINTDTIIAFPDGDLGVSDKRFIDIDKYYEEKEDGLKYLNKNTYISVPPKEKLVCWRSIEYVIDEDYNLFNWLETDEGYTLLQ